VQIKRSIIELKHADMITLVDRSKTQVEISAWESQQVKEGVSPDAILRWQEEIVKIDESLANNEQVRNELEERLALNCEKGRALESEFLSVEAPEMRQFLTLLYRLQMMEVENMEVSEENQMTEILIKQKDLESEKLRLQIVLRDQIIEEQATLLGPASDSLVKPEDWQVVEMPAQYAGSKRALVDVKSTPRQVIKRESTNRSAPSTATASRSPPRELPMSSRSKTSPERRERSQESRVFRSDDLKENVPTLPPIDPRRGAKLYGREEPKQNLLYYNGYSGSNQAQRLLYNAQQRQKQIDRKSNMFQPMFMKQYLPYAEKRPAKWKSDTAYLGPPTFPVRERHGRRVRSIWKPEERQRRHVLNTDSSSSIKERKKSVLRQLSNRMQGALDNVLP